MRTKPSNCKTLAPRSPFFLGSTSLCIFSPFPVWQCKVLGNGNCDQFIMLALSLLILFRCSSMEPFPQETVHDKFLHCGSLPWPAVLHELPQCGFLSWCAVLQDGYFWRLFLGIVNCSAYIRLFFLWMPNFSLAVFKARSRYWGVKMFLSHFIKQ